MKTSRLLPIICCVAALMITDCAPAEVRIKDVTRVVGRQTNALEGIGLVVGLNGTGGSTADTRRFAINLLQRFGSRSDPATRATIANNTQIKTDNLSVVVVTATLPEEQAIGDMIDVTVSAFDDAESLQGGVLIYTPLMGVDGEVYAVAQGPLTIGGFTAGGNAASVQKNHPTTGRIPNGATIEKTLGSKLVCNGRVYFSLFDPNFLTASRIAEAVNVRYPLSAKVENPRMVSIIVPARSLYDPNPFIAEIESLLIVPDTEARVVINERTGTVVIGENVRLSRVLINHGNLAIITAESPIASQPAPFSEGETTVLPRTQVDVIEERQPVRLIDETTTVGDLAQALNALGVTPRDLSAIFQQLKEAGALHAELQYR